MRDRILLWIAHIVWRRPRVIVAAAMILAIASGMYAAHSLVLNANTDDLVAPDRPYMVEYRRLLEEFGDLEHIFVVVENHTDPQRTQAIVDALTAKLRTIRDLPAVHCAIEPHEQLRLTTRAMPEDELEDFLLASGAFPGLASGDE
jgi:predicted RND superfamily exporter protein